MKEKKIKYKGESIFEPIYKRLCLLFNIYRAMEEAAKRWGSGMYEREEDKEE